jgi:hypothetical protein
MSKLTEDKIVGLVKFTDRSDFDRCVNSEFVTKLRTERFPSDYDQVLIIGTVRGHDVLEVRFIKTKKDEHNEVRNAENGDSGQQQ